MHAFVICPITLVLWNFKFRKRYLLQVQRFMFEKIETLSSEEISAQNVPLLAEIKHDEGLITVVDT